MKHIKKFNESFFDNMTDDQKRKALIANDKCPVCASDLIEEEDGSEDEVMYRICPEDRSHYSKCLGYRDDIE